MRMTWMTATHLNEVLYCGELDGNLACAHLNHLKRALPF